jgi:hypothetical protein
MNHPEKWINHREYKINMEVMKLGFRPLHTMIGVFGHIVNLRCKLFLSKDKSQARGADRAKKDDEHKKLQQDFIEEFNLRVDFPRPEGGTSTSGKTARVAFENPHKLANVTGVDEELITILALLLIAIRSYTPINAVEFERLCKRAHEIYVSKYANIPMSPKLHQLLIHGPKILENLSLPPGFYSEEGPEASNKHLREDRDIHARHDTREHNLEDVMHYAWIRSDPKISKVGLNERQKKKKKHKMISGLEKLLLIDSVMQEVEICVDDELNIDYE